MQDLDINRLRQDFALLTHPQADKPKVEGNWWETTILNLNDVAPSVGAMWRINRAACTMSLRRQYTSCDLEAIRRFAEWCSKTYAL